MSLISPKTVYWIKTLSKFVSVQLLVQILGVASGILLVRTLPKQEYAYFTLANAMQSTMNILADSGISTALSAIGGKVWQDPYRFGQLVNTAMQMRRYLAIIAVGIVTPILLWMLIKNGAGIGYAMLLTVGLLIELNFYLTMGILGTVLRLHSQINRIQNLDLLFTVSRLLLVGGAYLTFLNAAVAVFASTIASGVQNLTLRRSVTDSIDVKAPANKDDREQIIKFVKAESAYFIFYCIQGQVTIWLISIFGTQQNIAEIGALSRLGLIFAIISSVMSSIVVPSYARCQDIVLLRHRFWKIIGTFFILSIILISLTSLFPRELLWILGTQYANLQSEVFWIVSSSMLHSIAGSLLFLNRARGWVQESWMIIPSTVTTQIVLLLFLDVSTVKGVILFGMFSILPTIAVHSWISYKGLKVVV